MAGLNDRITRNAERLIELSETNAHAVGRKMAECVRPRSAKDRDKLADTYRVALSAYLGRKRTWRADHLEAFAAAFGITVNELLDGGKRPQKTEGEVKDLVGLLCAEIGKTPARDLLVAIVQPHGNRRLILRAVADLSTALAACTSRAEALDAAHTVLGREGLFAGRRKASRRKAS